MAGSSRPASSQAAPKEDEDEDLGVSPCNETVGGGGRGAFNTWSAARDIVEDANPLVGEQGAQAVGSPGLGASNAWMTASDFIAGDVEGSDPHLGERVSIY